MRLPISRPDLPARQFGHVGVLLLREHRAAGGEGVVEDREPELLARPDHQFLAHAREMDTEEREVEEGLGHEVPVGDRVHRILEARRRNPRSSATPSGSSGSDDPASAPGTERRDVDPVERVEQPVDVAGERPPVGEQVVREQDGLGTLQVGVAGKVDVARLLRPG